jgi:hypothetical protein
MGNLPGWLHDAAYTKVKTSVKKASPKAMIIRRVHRMFQKSTVMRLISLLMIK